MTGALVTRDHSLKGRLWSVYSLGEARKERVKNLMKFRGGGQWEWLINGISSKVGRELRRRGQSTMSGMI